MRFIIFPLSVSVAMGVGFCMSQSQLLPQSSSQPSPPPEVAYQTHNLPDAVVHLVQIPKHKRYSIRPRLAPGLMTVDEVVQGPNAADADGPDVQTIAAINGGYFDPVNQQTTSYVRIGSKVEADPQKNSRLLENPDLKPYLPKILNRSEFRQYQCGADVEYAITTYQAPVPNQCELAYSMGAGPQLLPQLTSQAEGFTDTVDGQVVRDAIGSRQPNARSAIGITRRGDLVWAMVEQKSADQPGLSLEALAEFLQQQDVETALNLDGGSSSSLMYRGKVQTGKSQNGQPLLRPVKSVLMLQENAPN